MQDFESLRERQAQKQAQVQALAAI